MASSKIETTPAPRTVAERTGEDRGLRVWLLNARGWAPDTDVSDEDYAAALAELHASGCAYPAQPPMHGTPDALPGTYRRRGTSRTLTPRRARGRSGTVLGGRK